LFVNNALQINVAGDLVTFLEQDIASVFICRFRCSLQLFSGKKSPFQRLEQIWKSSLGFCNTCRNVWENFQNLKKWVQSLCAPLWPFKSELKENFYHSILPHVLYICTRIKTFHCFITGCHEKLSSSYWCYQKCTVGPTFVCTESLLSRAIFKNILGAFYRGWYVVVHAYSNFSLSRQIAPLWSIKFQTADFPISAYVLLWSSEQCV